MADLDDIEDLFHKTGADGDGEDDMDDPLADIRRVQGTDSVLPKARRPRHSGTADEVTTDKSAVGLIPGTGNVYIKTWVSGTHPQLIHNTSTHRHTHIHTHTHPLGLPLFHAARLCFMYFPSLSHRLSGMLGG